MSTPDRRQLIDHTPDALSIRRNASCSALHDQASIGRPRRPMITSLALMRQIEELFTA